MPIVRMLFTAAALAVVAACASTAEPTKFPAPVTKLVSTETFPTEAGGFERGEVIAYAEGMKHLSAEYSLLADGLQIAATIDFTPHEAGKTDLAEQFKEEKVAIEKYYLGARWQKQEEIQLEKKGSSYKALKAGYEFEGMFRGQRQQVYAELILWSQGDRWVKLRIMAPSWQRKKLAPKGAELLDAVDWSS
jgi:hypothetical protein